MKRRSRSRLLRAAAFYAPLLLIALATAVTIGGAVWLGVSVLRDLAAASPSSRQWRSP